METREAAREVRDWLENAMFDAGDPDCLFGKWEKKAEKMRRQGCNYYQIKESIAELMYNDEEELEGLVGDKIYDHSVSVSQSKGLPRGEVFIAICQDMLPMAHPALKKALEKLIERHKDLS